MSPFTCDCGREFASGGAMSQHRQKSARAQCALEVACSQTSNPSKSSRAVKPIEAVRSNSNMLASSPKPKPWTRHTKLVPVSNPKDRWMLRDVGSELQSITSESLCCSDVKISSSDGSELICSYNWVHDKKPTIYVPGKYIRIIRHRGAPVWKAVELPHQLPADKGIEYIDLNTFKLPKYPFEVLFQATRAMRPEFRFDKIDLVINRNSLRNLLSFSLGRSGKGSFRINLFLINNTLIVERCTRNATAMIQGQGGGHGHNFELAFTEPMPGLGDSSFHHRVLRYKMGHLDCAVRFEVDACYHGSKDRETASPSENSPSANSSGANTDVTDTSKVVDDLKLGSLNLQEKIPPTDKTSPKTQSSVPGSIVAIVRGAGTLQEHTAELKTGAKAQSPLHHLPQLWFGRTPFLVAGSHSNGNFHTVNITDVSSQFEVWEKDNATQEGLQKMVGLLSELREVTRKTKGGACVAVFEQSVKPRVLRLFEPRSGRGALPEYIIKEFWSGSTG